MLTAALAAALAATDSLFAPGAFGERPELSGRSAILVDARDGHVLYRRAPAARRPIASATKLMTALVALEELPLGRRLTAAPYRAASAESRIDLRPGERMKVRDLMRALLLESANDAAVTLARGVSPTVGDFVARMNERARELGLLDTHFANPIGLDETGNYSTAVDLSRLTRVLLRNRAFERIVDLPSAALRTGSRPRVVSNRNRLVARVPWIDGVKTGHTLGAGYVLVGAGTRKGVRLVSVVLGASSEAQRDSDTLALLGYGFDFYRRERPVRRGRVLARPKVAFHGDRRARLGAARAVALTVRRGERVRTLVRSPGELRGPIERGEPVGTVGVFVNRRVVRRVPLVALEAVPGAGAGRRAADFLGKPGTIVALVVLALAGGAAYRRRQRPNAD